MERALRRLAEALLIAAAALAEEPHSTIRVEVTAESKPVPDAQVRLAGRVLRTGPDGVAITTTAPGPVAIRVIKEGFLPAETSLAVDAEREWVVRVELHPATVEEQITVHATRNDVRLQDSPLRVEVLQRDEIEEKLLMTPGDVVMMLNEMGGMRVQTTSPALGAASVRIQGMRGRYTRFLSDGLPLFGQQGAGLGLLQTPPMDLGQVEVIKGTASALYGSAAMAGVVNLISRRPGTEPVHEFLVNRSTRGASDGVLFVASPLSTQWSASLLGGGHFQERNDIDGDGWADLPGYQRGVVRPRFFWDGDGGRTAMISGGVTYEDRSGGGTISGAPYREALDTRRYDIGGSAQALFAGSSVGTGRFSASVQQHHHQFGAVTEDDRHELLFGELSLRGAGGRHTWVAGAAVERDAYRPRDVPRFAYSYVTPGIFVQDDVRAASWLSFSASGRADFHNRYGTFLSPRVSALVQAAGWTGRLSAGQGFFAPTPLTEETEAAGLTLLSVPFPLRAERGRSASFDLTRSAGPLAVTGTVFASSISHPIFVDRGSQYRIVNLPEASTNRGVEMLATWRKAPSTGTLSYTYVRSREQDTSGRRSEVPLTPRHSFGAVGMWEREKSGRLGVECYYTGRQRLENNPFRALSRTVRDCGESWASISSIPICACSSTWRTSPMYGRPAGIRYSVPYAVLTGAGRWMRGRRWRAG